MNSPKEEFRTAIQTSGMIPPALIEPKKFHRFSDNGGRNKNGWCVYYQNPDGSAGGIFGSWRGETQTWFSGNGNMSPETRKQLEEQITEAKKQNEDARRLAYAKAAKQAAFIYGRYTPVTDNHPYLLKKGVKAYDGVQQYKNLLAIPLLDVDKNIRSLQFIAKDGSKRFLKNGQMKGSLFCIKGDDTLALCEGYATGASIFEATGYTPF